MERDPTVPLVDRQMALQYHNAVMATTSERVLVLTLLGVGCALSAVGCAGLSPMESGYLLGSIAGGAAAGPAGAALGSAVGTLAGAMMAKPIEQHRENEERKQLQAQLGAPTPLTRAAGAPEGPMVTPPPTGSASGRERPSRSDPQGGSPAGGGVMTRVWVDEQVERGRVVAGHFEERPVSHDYLETNHRPLELARPL